MFTSDKFSKTLDAAFSLSTKVSGQTSNLRSNFICLNELTNNKIMELSSEINLLVFNQNINSNVKISFTDNSDKIAQLESEISTVNVNFENQLGLFEEISYDIFQLASLFYETGKEVSTGLPDNDELIDDVKNVINGDKKDNKINLQRLIEKLLKNNKTDSNEQINDLESRKKDCELKIDKINKEYAFELSKQSSNPFKIQKLQNNLNNCILQLKVYDLEISIIKKLGELSANISNTSDLLA